MALMKEDEVERGRGREEGGGEMDPLLFPAPTGAELGSWGAHSQRGSAWLCQYTANEPDIQPRASGTCGPWEAVP